MKEQLPPLTGPEGPRFPKFRSTRRLSANSICFTRPIRTARRRGACGASSTASKRGGSDWNRAAKTCASSGCGTRCPRSTATGGRRRAPSCGTISCSSPASSAGGRNRGDAQLRGCIARKYALFDVDEVGGASTPCWRRDAYSFVRHRVWQFDGGAIGGPTPFRWRRATSVEYAPPQAAARGCFARRYFARRCGSPQPPLGGGLLLYVASPSARLRGCKVEAMAQPSAGRSRRFGPDKLDVADVGGPFSPLRAGQTRRRRRRRAAASPREGPHIASLRKLRPECLRIHTAFTCDIARERVPFAADRTANRPFDIRRSRF